MTDQASGPVEQDTIPKLLERNVQVLGDKPAMREKDYGIWQSWTWAEAADEIRALACGLKAIGLNEGDKIVVCGDNRPHLYFAITAIQAAGGVPVPVYQDSVAEEMQYIYEHAEARFSIVENQEQVDKVIEIMDRTPALERVIYNDPRGLRNYTQTFLMQYSAAQD